MAKYRDRNYPRNHHHLDTSETCINEDEGRNTCNDEDEGREMRNDEGLETVRVSSTCIFFSTCFYIC